MKFPLILLFSFFSTYALLAQGSNRIRSEKTMISADKKAANIYFIQVAVYSNPEKYFPKLYPIGYIVTKTDKKKGTTKFLLGDFTSRAEAEKALEKVKIAGFTDAFIVEMSE